MQLGELDLGSEAEEEGSDVEEARGAVAKAARRGGGARAAPRQTAVTADMLSTLLAGAPALVDCLLLEDSVRRWALGAVATRVLAVKAPCILRLPLKHAICRPDPPTLPPKLLCSITLCCRDVVNLNIAAGGGVNLEPVWEALASHVKWVLVGVWGMLGSWMVAVLALVGCSSRPGCHGLVHASFALFA